MMRAVALGCWLACASLAPARAAETVALATSESTALRAGDSLESALAALTARGHRIVYSSALVTPDMTLQVPPKATRIDALLDEILSPWRLRAVQAGNGDWLVVAVAAAAPPTTSVGIEMPPEAEELQTVDVTASRYSLATPDATRVFLDRKGVERMPHLADDAMRMLKVLPGVSGGDFSAALNIRGGRREETLLRIDGAEVHSGFHFRDLDGALSVLDTNLVDSVDFITGGMTTRYGDHLSGVVDMRTRRPHPEDEYRHAAGVSFVSAYGRTGGTFADGRGAWLASARRGYLDVVMERIQADDEQITPRYTDLFGSIYYDFGDDTSIAAHVLLGEDDLELVSSDEDDIDSAGEGRAAHAWITLGQKSGDRLESSTVLSVSRVRQWRQAQGEDSLRTGDVDAAYRFTFFDARSDWTWTLTERQMLLFGANAGLTEADYDYTLTGTITNPTVPGGLVDISRADALAVRGRKLGAHAAWRSRLARRLVVEAGARWDQYAYPGDLTFEVVSPRVNLVHEITGRGEIRAAWGVAYQPQGIDELQVEDDVTQFFGPERVQQAVLGYAHRFDRGLSARVDVYRKLYSRLRPRFENVLDPVQLIPEGSVDRVRIDAPEARARGVEVTLRREAERGFSGWVSLVLAETEERVVGQGWVPRLWDQRRALSFGAAWTGEKWNFNLAGLHHSGAPTTALRHATVPLPSGLVDVIDAGPRNAQRLGAYARVDLRASRKVQLRNSRLSWYVEMTNLLDRDNPCCKDDYHLAPRPGPVPDSVQLVVREGHWLPMLPSFGFQFEF
jgi:outer membrane cobalamin receptor